ncbi:hypothetical protein AVEN_77527-1 [Araneus ventricosus]|uniref:Uncharacterized protein n=1 Tax=Araneus ventricosus TaxID=182803 RepID=A0A4Y2EZ59_ARAVE|nr:hypothetical protein AVEN_77527-1 [Araneus ventricosus]
MVASIPEEFQNFFRKMAYGYSWRHIIHPSNGRGRVVQTTDDIKEYSVTGIGRLEFSLQHITPSAATRGRLLKNRLLQNVTLMVDWSVSHRQMKRKTPLASLIFPRNSREFNYSESSSADTNPTAQTSPIRQFSRVILQLKSRLLRRLLMNPIKADLDEP